MAHACMACTNRQCRRVPWGGLQQKSQQSGTLSQEVEVKSIERTNRGGELLSEETGHFDRCDVWVR
jgi:hypothetical protein